MLRRYLWHHTILAVDWNLRINDTTTNLTILNNCHGGFITVVSIAKQLTSIYQNKWTIAKLKLLFTWLGRASRV